MLTWKTHARERGTIADAQSRAQRGADDEFARDGSAGGSRLLSAGGSGLRLSGRYVVEQGPIFTGPGPCLRQPNEPAPAAYPYVGHVFTGYPYGESTVSAAIRGASIVHISAIHMRSLIHQCRSGGTGIRVTRGHRRAVHVQ